MTNVGRLNHFRDQHGLKTVGLLQISLICERAFVRTSLPSWDLNSCWHSACVLSWDVPKAAAAATRARWSFTFLSLLLSHLTTSDWASMRYVALVGDASGVMLT
jgi:hypothetical protein